MWGGLELGSGSERVLVLLPGFIISARADTGLVSPLVASRPRPTGGRPQLYRIGPGCCQPVLGGPGGPGGGGPGSGLARAGVPVWLAGHSRAGHAAWLAAEVLEEDRPAGRPGRDRPGVQRRSPIGYGPATAILRGPPGDWCRDRLPLRSRGGEPPAVRHRSAAPDPRHSPGMRPRGRALRSGVALGSGAVPGRTGPTTGPGHRDRPDRRLSAR